MSQSNSNLDLLNVDSEDYSTLVSKIDTFYQADSSLKNQLGWAWERNQLMLDGKQWLVYYGDKSTGGQWQRASISKQNEYIPRPVTNYLFANYQTLKSYLIKEKPRSEVFPNTMQHKDKVAAKIATMVLECNWAKLHEDYNYETAAASLLAYGTVFKKSYWDTSTLSLVKVPRMEPTPITDPLTGQVIGMQETPAVDPLTGDELFDELPLGDLNTEIVDPFRITLDPLAMNLHEAKWIMEYSIVTLDQAREIYSKDEPGYTGEAAELTEETQLNTSMQRWFQLKTSSGQKYMSTIGNSGSMASDSMVENSVVLKQYYERPSSKYPKGRLIVSGAGKILYSYDSPYDGEEPGDWHPYSDCRWELVPGRFWGRSPLDDGIEIQKHINTIDSAIILTRKSTAMPKVLLPIGCGISPGEWTGRPGQMHFYRAQPGGDKPTLLPGTGVGQDTFQERAQRITDLKEIMGASDILQGGTPEGVNAASAINLLYEVSQGKLAPILNRWKMFVESDQKKQLKIIAKYYKEPRPEFIRLLMSKNRDLSETEVNQFLGSDLHDNCNVVVEAGSNIPKLQAAKQSLLVQLASMGVLNLQDPTNRIQFQQDMGITGYDSDVGPDQKRSQWENDLLDNLVNQPDNKPIVLDIDNHAIHIQEHSLRMKSPAWMSLPFPIQQAYTAHIQQHEQFQNAQLQAQMLQQQAMAPRGQQPPQQHQQQAPQQAAQHKPPRHPTDSHGPGPGQAIKNVILGSDLLTPSTVSAQR